MYERRLKMAGGWKKGRVHRDPFPEIPGMPNRSELMKPLIFPNSQRGFKIFTVVATVGENNLRAFLFQDFQHILRSLSEKTLISTRVDWHSFDPTCRIENTWLWSCQASNSIIFTTQILPKTNA